MAQVKGTVMFVNGSGAVCVGHSPCVSHLSVAMMDTITKATYRREGLSRLKVPGG